MRYEPGLPGLVDALTRAAALDEPRARRPGGGGRAVRRDPRTWAGAAAATRAGLRRRAAPRRARTSTRPRSGRRPRRSGDEDAVRHALPAEARRHRPAHERARGGARTHRRHGRRGADHSAPGPRRRRPPGCTACSSADPWSVRRADAADRAAPAGRPPLPVRDPGVRSRRAVGVHGRVPAPVAPIPRCGSSITLHEVRRELDLLGPVGPRIYRSLVDLADGLIVHSAEAHEARRLGVRCRSPPGVGDAAGRGAAAHRQPGARDG